MADGARLLHDGVAGVEGDEVWDAAHVETRRDFRIAFGIEFDDDGTSGHVSGGASNFRSRDPARPTPRRPEIHQHRDAGILNDFVEDRRINFQRFIQGRQWIFTSATPPGVVEVRRWNAVQAVTDFAGSNYSHRSPADGLSPSSAKKRVRDEVAVRVVLYRARLSMT